MHMRREIWQDVLGENPPRRSVEKIPSPRIKPVTGLLEAFDGSKDTRQMLRVDRDDEAGTGQAAAETRAQAGVAVVARHDRCKAIMAKRSGPAQRRDDWRGCGSVEVRSSCLAGERSSGAEIVSSPRS